MKLGVLNCDRLAEELRRDYHSYPAMFEKLFSQVQPSLRYQAYAALEGELPQSLDACDAYLITGSKCSVYDDLPWLDALADFIVTAHHHRIKLIGICFGHQLIADCLGGKAQKSDQGWGIGVMSARIVSQTAWMNPEPPNHHFDLLVSHQDQVVQLPPKAELIATSDFCPCAAFAIDEHILCFQGHPEFTKAYSRCLMDMRREIIGQHRIQEGLESLSRETHHLLVAQWILKFIYMPGNFSIKGG